MYDALYAHRKSLGSYPVEPAAMLRPRLLRAALPRFGLGQVRREHTLPPMEKFENGIDGLMTPLGFQIAWKDYQQMLVDKINQYTSGPYSFQIEQSKVR